MFSHSLSMQSASFHSEASSASHFSSEQPSEADSPSDTHLSHSYPLPATFSSPLASARLSVPVQGNSLDTTQDLFHWKLSEISHYLVLHHLRADLRNHVTQLTQSTYDILSFKNLLFSMYQKPISYEMLQDLVLLSSRQYRVTMDLYRDLSSFFRICFLGEKQEGYDAEEFEGQPIYAGKGQEADGAREVTSPATTVPVASNDFFSQLLKVLERRIIKGQPIDELQLHELQQLALKQIPERTDDNYDFTAFRLLMRQYKECMSLIVKQEDDLHEATKYIEEMEPKLREQHERNEQLQKENETLQQKLLTMEQKYDETFDHVSGAIFNQSGTQIRKAKNDQKLNKKYVSQLGKKFNDTVTTISSRLKLFHRTLLEVMDDEKSKLSVEANVKMNTMIVHVTHLIQKFDDIREALVEISNELDKVLKSKIQTATSGLTSMKAIAKENKKVLKAKKTLANMKTYLSDLKTVSQLLEDYQHIRPTSIQQQSSGPSDEVLNKVRSLIMQNVNGVNGVHDEVHEVLSSINLTAARNVEKEKKKKQEKKVNRFNLTVPILQSRSQADAPQQDSTQDDAVEGHPPNLDLSVTVGDPSETDDSILSPPLSSWKDKRKSARKLSFEEISSMQPPAPSDEELLKEKYNGKISFVKEVYDSRIKDLQQRLSLAHERIKELEKKRPGAKENKNKQKKQLPRTSSLSHMSDSDDMDAAQQNDLLHEHHFAEDFNYVDPDQPDELEAVSRLRKKTEKMMQGLGVLEDENPVTKGLKKELTKVAKEKVKLQRRGKKKSIDTFTMLQRLSPTVRDYSLPSPSDESVYLSRSGRKVNRTPRTKPKETISRSSSAASSSDAHATADEDEMQVYPSVLNFMPEPEESDGEYEGEDNDEEEDSEELTVMREEDIDEGEKSRATTAQNDDRAQQKSRKRKQSPRKSATTAKRSTSRSSSRMSALSTTPLADEQDLIQMSRPAHVSNVTQEGTRTTSRSNTENAANFGESLRNSSAMDEKTRNSTDSEEETIFSPDLIAPSVRAADNSARAHPPYSSLHGQSNNAQSHRTRPVLTYQENSYAAASPQYQGRPYSQGAANPHASQYYHQDDDSHEQTPHDEGTERRRSNSLDASANNGLVKLPSIMTPFEGPPQAFRGVPAVVQQGKQPKWLTERVKILQQDSMRGQKRYISNLDVFGMFNDDPEPMKPSYAPAATTKLKTKTMQNKKK